MGMDVYGNKPQKMCGDSFAISARAWCPLATYLWEVAPEITAKCKHWYTNDFDGLNGEDSSLLSDLRQEEIDSGRAERYRWLRWSQIELAPNDPCSQCKATGTDKPTQGRRAGDPTKNGIVCACDELGSVPSSVANYQFPFETQQQFAYFLRYCGGFQIC